MHENFLKSEILSLSNISHGFFGKFFEENSGIRDFNCSKYVGDYIDHVESNLQTVCSCLKSKKIITLKQVHGNKCIIVDSSTESDQEADAMVTKIPGIALGILTADCVPILLADPVAGVIGAAHAGWRSAVGQEPDSASSLTSKPNLLAFLKPIATSVSVIEVVVDKMILLGASPKNIRVCLGPSIFEKNYVVSHDFRENFSAYSPKLINLDTCFSTLNNQFHFNLPKFCKLILRHCDIPSTNISQIPFDTYSNPDRFFSYRYMQKYGPIKSGRNISAIAVNLPK